VRGLDRRSARAVPLTAVAAQAPRGALARRPRSADAVAPRPKPSGATGKGGQVGRRRAFILAVAWAACGTAAPAAAQSRAPIVQSIDLQVGPPPAVVTVGGRRHLVHELHVTNFRPAEVTLTRVDVLDAESGTV